MKKGNVKKSRPLNDSIIKAIKEQKEKEFAKNSQFPFLFVPLNYKQTLFTALF